MEKSIKLKFKTFGEFIIKFPNVGQSISIQSLKDALSEGRYGSLARSGVKESEEALDKIDALSVFSILIPELKEKLKLNDKNISFLELDQFTAKEIVSVYNKQFFPWYNEILKELRDFDASE